MVDPLGCRARWDRPTETQRPLALPVRSEGAEAHDSEDDKPVGVVAGVDNGAIDEDEFAAWIAARLEWPWQVGASGRLSTIR